MNKIIKIWSAVLLLSVCMAGCGRGDDRDFLADTQSSTESSVQEWQTAFIPNENTTVGDTVNIYFKNEKRWEHVYAQFFRSDEENEIEEIQMEVYEEEESGIQVLVASADLSKYNRVVFTDKEGKQTIRIPLSKASCAYYVLGKDSQNEGRFMVGNYAITGEGEGTLDTVQLLYTTTGQTGDYEKTVWIWTPADYDANAAEPYTTIYMMDGQNLFNENHTDSYGGWKVTDAVESAMANGARGVILVGIDHAQGWRDSELTPAIADTVDEDQDEFTELTGEEFSNFVVNTVMPYVQEHYHSSVQKEDNLIVGSSSGGLEAFYIGMEHPDLFGSIGALSPAFLLFNEEHWSAYFSTLDLSGKEMPKLYIYNGNGDFEERLFDSTIAVYQQLEDASYGNQIYLSIEEHGAHNEGYWRMAFSEMLGWVIQ